MAKIKEKNRFKEELLGFELKQKASARRNYKESYESTRSSLKTSLSPLDFSHVCSTIESKASKFKGSRDGAVVEHSSPTQASHQCDPGSIPGLGVKCGLSLLLVLVLAPRGFSPGTPVFPSPQKPTFPNSNSIWNSRATGLSVLSSTVKCHPR